MFRDVTSGELFSRCLFVTSAESYVRRDSIVDKLDIRGREFSTLDLCSLGMGLSMQDYIGRTFVDAIVYLRQRCRVSKKP
ncbi:hypothetical protein Csa_021240 [Cucumis sativus]|uniref:Uncharacterized protein n=1 Tax=Cucumis sativus TaxID=3659 RepID=A0A0A0LGS4_CUCSA|nr:hypothetical protein Csa_021240 [Cucumis sativus]